MKYYSTNGRSPQADLRKAVVKGLAEDRGLYMPERIRPVTSLHLDFVDLATVVADAFFGEDVPAAELSRIVVETLSFDCPVREVEPGIYALELFHGPTLAFKDVGARFMARLLQLFIDGDEEVHVLVATSGDTGSAVANGFLGVDGIRVHVLYPKGKVSPIQECQFATLGRNVTALEVDGTFDDCQALVKSAFMDADLNARMRLTSANSINVARFLPQAFYYFWAVEQLRRKGVDGDIVCSVPSGNFGNLCAALFAKRMGLPIARFVAANNANSVFYDFLGTGEYRPRPSVRTIANAMDVGDPSNFARIWDLYGHDVEAIRRDISSATYPDFRIMRTIRDCYARTGYLLDPHGACGYQSLREGPVFGYVAPAGLHFGAGGSVGPGGSYGSGLRPGETGFFCETAHPAKFKDTVESIIGAPVEIPDRLAAFMKGTKQSVPIPNDFPAFKDYLSSL